MKKIIALAVAAAAMPAMAAVSISGTTEVSYSNDATAATQTGFMAQPLKDYNATERCDQSCIWRAGQRHDRFYWHHFVERW
ncbi:hypothetical protein [Litorivicinus lipolyticus]|uniref:hypothetical protein n=1 Tax=Litorivicinus lipolyticus TaxID=418701 RepID=UPI003B5B848F